MSSSFGPYSIPTMVPTMAPTTVHPPLPGMSPYPLSAQFKSIATPPPQVHPQQAGYSHKIIPVEPRRHLMPTVIRDDMCYDLSSRDMMSGDMAYTPSRPDRCESVSSLGSFTSMASMPLIHPPTPDSLHSVAPPSFPRMAISLPSSSMGTPVEQDSTVTIEAVLTTERDVNGKYPCRMCTRTYAHAKHLRRHMMGHTGERPFGCGTCSQRFTRADIRNKHTTTCRIRIEKAKRSGLVVPKALKAPKAPSQTPYTPIYHPMPILPLPVPQTDAAVPLPYHGNYAPYYSPAMPMRPVDSPSQYPLHNPPADWGRPLYMPLPGLGSEWPAYAPGPHGEAPDMTYALHPDSYQEPLQRLPTPLGKPMAASGPGHPDPAFGRNMGLGIFVNPGTRY